VPIETTDASPKLLVIHALVDACCKPPRDPKHCNKDRMRSRLEASIGGYSFFPPPAKSSGGPGLPTFGMQVWTVRSARTRENASCHRRAVDR
jgi:hypothetical protein